MTFCNIYQRITNQNSAVTINCICQDDNRKEKSYRVKTRPNHFPSNGVATDPNDSVFLVFVTHLNTDVHLNIFARIYCFKTKINLSECYKMENSFVKKIFLNTL